MKKYVTSIAPFGIGMLLLWLGYLCIKKIPRIPLKQYTKFCLYMAVLDDEICRNELEGNFVGGEEIVFPPKPDSLQYRYHLFLEMYRNYSRNEIQHEIQRLEKRLEASKVFCNESKENLSISSKNS